MSENDENNTLNMFRHTNVFLVLFDITVGPKTDNLIKRTRHTKQQTAALNLCLSKSLTFQNTLVVSLLFLGHKI